MTGTPWANHYPGEVPLSLDYPKQSLGHFLEQSASLYPNQTAVSFLGKTLSYRQLLEQSYRFGNALKSLGVKKGDRIGIILPNSPQSIIAYYGALLIGAVVVQFNPMYMEREIHHQAADSGPQILVCLDLIYPKVINAIKGTPVEKIIVTSIKDYLPFPKNLLYPLKARKEGQYVEVSYSSNVLPFKNLIKSSSATPVKEDIDFSEDLALLQYTGGTTGLSKGVMLTHENLVSNTYQAMKWCWKCQPGKETMLSVLPFFHVYGMTVGMNLAIMLGAKMILLPRFQPADVLQTIEKERPTMFPGAPTMYIALLNHPDLKKYDLSSIEACISGSAPLPVEVQERFEEITGGRLVEGYGLTEASPVTHCNPIWGGRKNGSIGLPWPDTICKIVDPETLQEVERGKPGELIVKGPQVMKGYWNRPSETAEVLKDGWLLTGDIATVDEEGYFYIVDRKKNMIIAGGFNIYPREVEEVLFEHPAILEAAVIGVPDPYRGETVKAFIVLKEGHSVSESELNSFCRERLSAYKVPRLYEFRKELPKTMVGKVLKRALQEEESKGMSSQAESTNAS
ncbi:long-chain-fatty-acid--CoA ligase [Effusibacillus lacus]|uniref:Long-chain fatty acid--CoA ligase n=1 Tax=Effusibacillus lacus TaxID=1348429 RepID=A0A292YTF7_9BACL|nr:long-chain fatty acid--CoA ligase [Effusibacillus lacus]TCS75842.1 long-chain acyl-CoA synthetase [Effusibacillus lacus]GAX91765.1 long-chain fatty acid--CoA ligase [Effusibacillus lacus]